MEHKNTLSQYLYRTLTSQIHTGRLRPGDSLPSIRQLVEMYNVGIRTVKDVLKRMGEEGYIRTEIRKNAVVVYRPQEEDELFDVRELLGRRDALLDLYHTMAHLFPHILASGAMLCTPGDLQRIAKAAHGMEGLSVKAQWQVGSSIFQSIIAKYKSSLLTDLCIDIENYASLPLFPGLKNPYDDFFEFLRRIPERLPGLIAQNDYRSIYLDIEANLTRLAECVEAYLNKLGRQYPQYAALPQSAFQWDAKKGRVHAYLEITRDIIVKIGTGVYEDQAMLPSIGQFCQQYGASPTTVMHALSILNTMCLVRTVNGKGSYVTMERARNASFQVTDHSAKQDAYTFLSALQLIVLTCRKTALLGMPLLGQQQIDHIAAEVNRPGNTSLPDVFLRTLLEAQPCAGLGVIYAGLRELLHWGFFFSFTRRDPSRDALLHTQCQKALSYLQHQQQDAFADILQDIYLGAYQHLKAALLGFGIKEIEQLVEPQQEYL